MFVKGRYSEETEEVKGYDFAPSQRSAEMSNILSNVVLASSEIKLEFGANT